MKQKDYSIILGDMGRNWWKHLDSIVFSTFEDNVPSKGETHMAHNAHTSILEAGNT